MKKNLMIFFGLLFLNSVLSIEENILTTKNEEKKDLVGEKVEKSIESKGISNQIETKDIAKGSPPLDITGNVNENPIRVIPKQQIPEVEPKIKPNQDTKGESGNIDSGRTNKASSHRRRSKGRHTSRGSHKGRTHNDSPNYQGVTKGGAGDDSSTHPRPSKGDVDESSHGNRRRQHDRHHEPDKGVRHKGGVKGENDTGVSSNKIDEKLHGSRKNHQRSRHHSHHSSYNRESTSHRKNKGQSGDSE